MSKIGETLIMIFLERANSPRKLVGVRDQKIGLGEGGFGVYFLYFSKFSNSLSVLLQTVPSSDIF